MARPSARVSACVPADAMGIARLDSDATDWENLALSEPDAPFPDAPLPEGIMREGCIAQLPSEPYPMDQPAYIGDCMPSEVYDVEAMGCPVGLGGRLACLIPPLPVGMFYGKETEEAVRPRFHPVPMRPVFLSEESGVPETIATPEPSAIPGSPAAEAPPRIEILIPAPPTEELLPAPEDETEPRRLDLLTQRSPPSSTNPSSTNPSLSPPSRSSQGSWIFGRDPSDLSLASRRSEQTQRSSLR